MGRWLFNTVAIPVAQEFFPVHLFGKIGKWEGESIAMFYKRRQILQPHMMRQ